jgi:hypothetical protein
LEPLRIIGVEVANLREYMRPVFDFLIECMNPTLAGIQGAIRAAYRPIKDEQFDDLLTKLDEADELMVEPSIRAHEIR